MERAGKLLVESKVAAHCTTPEQLVVATWAHAVGKKIARHTRVSGLVRDRLVVDVEDLTWQRQLHPMTAQIVTRIAAVLVPGIVGDIEFRVAPPRRQPGREETVGRVDEGDPSERVADPILDRIYRASKRKAIAGSKADKGKLA